MQHRENVTRALVILVLILAIGIALVVLQQLGTEPALALSTRLEGAAGVLLLAFVDVLRATTLSGQSERARERLESLTITIGDVVAAEQRGRPPLRGEVIGFGRMALEDGGERVETLTLDHGHGDVRLYPMSEIRRVNDREPTGGHRLEVNP